jgi:hypothetical protein
MARTARTRKTLSQPTRGRLGHETHLQWTERLALADTIRRRPGEPLLTPETEAQASYVDALVTHVETNTRAQTKRNSQQSALAQMHERSAITAAQYEAALQIARIAERISLAGSLRGSRLEPRVDCASSGRDFLAERLNQVRLEMTYTTWRDRLPMPRRMVIDMVVSDRELVATARVHNVPWRQARTRLIGALDLWLELRERIWRDVDAQDAERAYRRLGEGRLL